MNSERNQQGQSPMECKQELSEVRVPPDDVQLVQQAIQNNRRNRNMLVFGVVLAVAALVGLFYWLHARHFEDTDDAQIIGYLSPIGTRVNGTVLKVYVQNNQVVHAGDPLVDLDPCDFQVKLDMAKAQLAEARGALSEAVPNILIAQVQNATDIQANEAEVAGAQASLGVAERDRDRAQAQLLQQQAANTRAQTDLQRYRLLAAKQEISNVDFDQYNAIAKQQAAGLMAAKAALLAAWRLVDQRKAMLAQARSRLVQSEKNAGPRLSIRKATVSQQEANLQSAQAQLEQARLDLSYTKIVAPVSGIVINRSAQVGARVSSGQQLLTISQTRDLWVTANFKETQLLHIKPGEPATIHVDALDRDFTGSVEAIGGATGSIASVLPPENATGNFVKVVQRIPVRIKLDPNQKGLDQLRPGMSVEPKVHIQ